MSIPTIIKTGLSILLDNPILREGVQQKAIEIIKTHFCYSSDEIYQAYQDSYAYSITAISAGLAAPDTKLLNIIKKTLYSKVTREFAEPIERNYFQAFAKKTGVQPQDYSDLRQQLINELYKIVNVSFFKVETEIELSALINYQASDNLSQLILDKIAPVDDTLSQFLRYEELLGKAILFFFRELMRKDDRLYKTQAALQRENLFVEIEKIQEIVQTAESNLNLAMNQRSKNLAEIAEKVTYLHQAQDTWDARTQVLIDFPAWQNLLDEKIELLLQGVYDANQKIEELHKDVGQIGEQLGDVGRGVEANNSKLDKLIEMLTIMMQQQNLSSQLKPSDEFTQHNSKSLKLINEAISQFKQISKNDPNYSKASIMLGSALSSTGDLKKSERLFEDVLERSSNKSEIALAHFNLFQIQVRSKNYTKAVQNLQKAIKLDYASFALHNARKYPPVRLLGAGGMGVVFLCENKNFLLKGVKKLVVKCFWETVKGSSEEVFKEPLAMSEIAGDYVPESFDYGYMYDFKEERGFFVTEYIEGAMDGEAWLEKYGPMDVKTGLIVALAVAKGLQLAHDKGIFHLDLKPANLLLKPTNSGVEVKIIDFGLSQVASSLGETAVQQSRSGLSFFGNAVLCGTLDYAPPEQQSYDRYLEPGAKNDVFAFGAMMYRLFTGKRPRPFSERKLPKVDSLRELLCDCVEDDPEERPDSARDLVNSLERIKSDISEEKAAKREAERLAEEEKKAKFFQFEIVSVNTKGEIVKRAKKEANYERQDLNGVILDMVSIPGGSFMMGSPESEKDRSSNEKQHKVEISPFYIDKYPVTQAQWQAVMGNNPSYFKGDNRPVDTVSWNDAVEFCQKLSELTGDNYRLPTEAEWEYACRAGTTTQFYFGETITTDLVNYNGNYPYGDAPKGVYHQETTDVGSFPANEFGLYDMHGNVWEWCADIYSSDYSSSRSNPTDPSGGGSRVVRGGSWFHGTRLARAAYRDGDEPGFSYYYHGFRCARVQS